MCGICGVVSQSRTADPLLIQRMIGRLAHRGPDGSGYYRDERIVLGHARLAIIDAEGGAQPLSNEDETLWISFNGEIFNYLELGKELRQLGHRFRTACDTEVILHAWEEWGEGCFQRFNGQWAFALWDRPKGKLVLSRDRLGVRPLFYTIAGGRFLFASEIKALFADGAVAREFDPAGLRETFTFWSAVAPRTVYRGVNQLKPGHLAIYQEGVFTEKPYWSIAFPFSVDGAGLDENGRELRERLVNASRLRFLRSDVPVGAYLSGGIDSSVTAALIARYTSAPLRTFSLRFTDAEFDEGPFQAEMASRLATDHRSVEVSTREIAAVFPQTIWHCESPILRAAPAPLYILSRLVRESGYKVVVTGEGADEVLAGYDIFREMKVRLFWARDPSSTKRAGAVRLLYPWMRRSPTMAPSFGHAFFGRNLDPSDPAVSHRPRWDSTSSVMGLMTSEAFEECRRYPVEQELLSKMPPGSGSWDPLARAQWLEMTTLLPGYILSSQGDRMLMAHSVEGRFPFLDPEVVSFANSLPARHKLLGLDEKHLLKREFADLVPQSILRRPKQPYRAPDAASFFGGSRGDGASDWIGDLTSEAAVKRAAIFAPAAVSALFAKCAKVCGRGMSNTDNMRVLAVLSTMLAHHSFIAGDGSDGGADSPPQPMTVIDVTGRSVPTTR